jgi:hypothetical protein
VWPGQNAFVPQNARVILDVTPLLGLELCQVEIIVVVERRGQVARRAV